MEYSRVSAHEKKLEHSRVSAHENKFRHSRVKAREKKRRASRVSEKRDNGTTRYGVLRRAKKKLLRSRLSV